MSRVLALFGPFQSLLRRVLLDQRKDRTLRFALFFIAAWLGAGPFRILWARWTAKRRRLQVERYQDEEGISLEVDGLGAREVKAAIIKRDEKEEEEALEELVSHRNVACVLLKPPLSMDPRVVRRAHEFLEEEARFDVDLKMVSGDRLAEDWSDEERREAEKLCGGIGACFHPKPKPKEEDKNKDKNEDKGEKKEKGTDDEADETKGSEGNGSSSSEVVAPSQPETAVFLLSWDASRSTTTSTPSASSSSPKKGGMPTWSQFRHLISAGAFAAHVKKEAVRCGHGGSVVDVANFGAVCHPSSSALAALRERQLWVEDLELDDDETGKKLLGTAAVDQGDLESYWLKPPAAASERGRAT